MLLGFPQGNRFDVRLQLFASLGIDTGTSLPPKYSLPVSAASMVLFALNQRQLSTTSTWLENSQFLDGLLKVGVAFVLAAASMYIRFLLQSLSKEAETNATLDQSVRKLTDANTEFLQYASVVERESAVNERNRITRELHDVIGQTLTNISMMMDAAIHRADVSPEEMLKLHQWTREQAREGLESTRAALYELRAIPEQTPNGIQYIQKLIDTFSKLTHVKIKVEWGNLPWELEGVVFISVYRIIQESLSNSFRHGKATEVSIYFQVEGGKLHLSIWDNGRGSAEPKKGIGQAGMEERVKKLQGTITFSSEGGGYLVSASIPLAGEIAKLEKH
jgi:signal transduction histidine kinase